MFNFRQNKAVQKFSIGQSKCRKSAANEKLSDDLAKAWTAFYSGKYDEAAKLAEPLSKPSEKRFVWAAVEAIHIKARSMWAKGDGASRFEAQKMWQQL